MRWKGRPDHDRGEIFMIDVAAYSLVLITMLCFGLIVGFQFAHIAYVRKLITLAKRSVNSGTLAPIFAELENIRNKVRKS
jgi:hypothetical protein